MALISSNKNNLIKYSVLAVPMALTLIQIPAIAQQAQTYTYECLDGKSFQAQYGTDLAILDLDNQTTVTLPAVPASEVPLSPGEARYSDGSYLLYTTDNNQEAFIEVDDDRTHEGCIAQPVASAPAPTTQPAPVRALW